MASLEMECLSEVQREFSALIVLSFSFQDFTRSKRTPKNERKKSPENSMIGRCGGVPKMVGFPNNHGLSY